VSVGQVAQAGAGGQRRLRALRRPVFRGRRVQCVPVGPGARLRRRRAGKEAGRQPGRDPRLLGQHPRGRGGARTSALSWHNMQLFWFR